MFSIYKIDLDRLRDVEQYLIVDPKLKIEISENAMKITYTENTESSYSKYTWNFEPNSRDYNMYYYKEKYSSQTSLVYAAKSFSVNFLAFNSQKVVAHRNVNKLNVKFDNMFRSYREVNLTDLFNDEDYLFIVNHDVVSPYEFLDKLHEQIEHMNNLSDFN
ncbi:MAG: hypothetical protein CVV57_01690 [Tenericutes bacterium HGW-Tenericutes-2]|jgi:uncharacterized protein (UPF0333 family)|nr:MAG: hypothetical protein CVV57_01690 [Tenericutes bacterium HGW-Tenericutes-2]